MLGIPVRKIALPLLKVGGYASIVYSLVRDAKIGLYLMIFIIPLPSIWHSFGGDNFIDYLYISILLGSFLQNKNFSFFANSKIIFCFLLLSFISLCYGSFQYDLSFPFTTITNRDSDWKNYAQMISFYYISANLIRTDKDRMFALLIMAFIILLLSVQTYRTFGSRTVTSFSYDVRAGGPFESVGLGANHFAAFVAEYGLFLSGLALCMAGKVKYYLTIAAISTLYPLMFCFSRGAYVAELLGLALIGLLKEKKILIALFVLVLSWQAVLPSAVIDRISMTTTKDGKIEASAAERLELWEISINLFSENPLFGVGWGCFGFNVPSGSLKNSHNMYMTMAAESGIIGLSAFILILLAALKSGLKLFYLGKKRTDPFQLGLGLGFSACVIACMISNLFGDRWSYFILGSFFWIIWGIVDSAYINYENTNTTSALKTV